MNPEFVTHYDGKPLAAESGYRRGIELAPNNVLTHQQYGLYLTLMGRFDEALAELKLALAPYLVATAYIGLGNQGSRRRVAAKGV